MSWEDAYRNGLAGKSVIGQGYDSAFEGIAHAEGQAARAAANAATASSGSSSDWNTVTPSSLPAVRSGGSDGYGSTSSSDSKWAGKAILFILLGIGIFVALVNFGGGGSSNRSAAVQYVTVNTINLNLRSGPGTGYGVVAIMPQGLKAKLVARASNGWVELEVPGPAGQKYHGFANGNYVINHN